MNLNTHLDGTPYQEFLHVGGPVHGMRIPVHRGCCWSEVPRYEEGREIRDRYQYWQVSRSEPVYVWDQVKVGDVPAVYEDAKAADAKVLTWLRRST